MHKDMHVLRRFYGKAIVTCLNHFVTCQEGCFDKKT